MGVYRRAVRPLLYRLDAERAHELALGALVAGHPLLARVPGLRVADERLAQRLLGTEFPNPVGLAAGMDKRGRALPAWAALGFGFAEIGTVTAMPQPGNPRPRVFRLTADEAIVNRLGFNNDGAERTAERLAAWGGRGLLRRIPLGVNIGRSRGAAPEQAAADHARALAALAPFPDYLTVNVSSPNTPGLRALQAPEALAEILGALREVADLPTLVKVAPDLEPQALDAIVDVAVELGLAGLIVGNTTLARDGLRSPAALAAQEGGLSGPPLRARSTALVRRAAARAHQAGGRLVIVGAGGVATADDAWEKLAAGASLVQLYTGLVYGGPRTAARINAGLLARMEREGVASVAELVGRGSEARR